MREVPRWAGPNNRPRDRGGQNALELDDECEHFLAKLGDHADFEVDDALRKLLADGLVSIEGKTLAPTTELKALTMCTCRPGCRGRGWLPP